jgi:spore germination cell wall hydrolase CwlJ-like protein
VTLSDEDIIKLATIVYMESNSESYEGQLAVANVVINRLVSGIWGDTLDDVLYAPNQFAGAKTNIPKYKNKINESNIKAAKEAAAGNNNIGDYMYFRTVRGANLASYKKYYILGNHVFH